MKSPYEVMLQKGRERNQRALKMKLSGKKTLQQIGDALGVSRQRAAMMISSAEKENSNAGGVSKAPGRNQA